VGRELVAAASALTLQSHAFAQVVLPRSGKARRAQPKAVPVTRSKL
jgi:hypothetical protein